VVARAPGAAAPREAVRAWIADSALWSRAVAVLAGEAVPTFLVGGSIRDALRREPGVDLDIAVDGDAIHLGRRLADSMGGAFYTMDTGHGVGRIILDCDGSRRHIDLAGLRGGTIRDDLCARDLTVNAMGMALTGQLGELLDPTGGLGDLAQGIVRHAYPAAFTDDPLRLLRAVRMSAGLGFILHASTREAIGAQYRLLDQVSAERVRDELFLMLEQPTVAGLRLALELGLLADILAPVSVEQLCQGLGRLEALQVAICAPGSLAWRQHLTWSEQFASERSRRELMSLAAILSCADNEGRRAALGRLRLSGRESAHAGRALRALDDVARGICGPVCAVGAHRYYREYGAAGADGAALVLAAPAFPGLARQTASRLLAVWLDERDAVVSPTPILTGQELMRGLSIEPGPVVGNLLRGLAEAQVAGAVVGPDEAWAWARAALVREQFTGKQVEGRW
jgi:tRNA nucleotidyltransferase/poly(A) polymerase